MDLRKAFDTVNHLLLLRELRVIGVDDKMVDWFASYLGNRTQQSRVNGALSDRKPVCCGVPQGSVLGPLLFNIYINNIIKNLQHSRYYMYADDLALLVSGKDINIIHQLLQLDLNCVDKWCAEHRLTINAEKTKVLWCFSARKPLNLDDLDFVMKDIPLKTVSHFDYLGVRIDCHLSFTPYCSKVRNSLLNKLYNMRKLRRYMDKSLTLTLYKQMVLPVMDFGDFVIEGAPKLSRACFQTIQNHFLRCCLDVKDPQLLSREVIHELCLCKKLYARRKENLLLIMHKVSLDSDNVIVPTRMLRGNIKVHLKVQKSSAALYDKSPLYRGARYWDMLDPIIQHSPDRLTFKNNLIRADRLLQPLPNG